MRLWLALSLDRRPRAYILSSVYTCAFLWAHLCAQCACPWSAELPVLQSCPVCVSDQRWWRGVSCTGRRRKWGVLGMGGRGPYSAEVVRVRGLERRDGKDRNLDGTDTMSNGSSSWENKKYPRNTKTWGVKNMQLWREVRFPTISNSILQTVRKHAAAFQAPGKCAANLFVFTLSSFKLAKVCWDHSAFFPP